MVTFLGRQFLSHKVLIFFCRHEVKKLSLEFIDVFPWQQKSTVTTWWVSRSCPETRVASVTLPPGWGGATTRSWEALPKSLSRTGWWSGRNWTYRSWQCSWCTCGPTSFGPEIKIDVHDVLTVAKSWNRGLVVLFMASRSQELIDIFPKSIFQSQIKF